MKIRISIQALATCATALYLPACAISRPEETKEIAWIEAKRLLAESKALKSHALAPEIPTTTARTLASRVATPLRDRFHPTRTTAYYHGEADHLAYGCKSALGSDLVYGAERSAAADWSRYPLGTRFRIVGDTHDCEYRIDDYGKALVGTNTIDLYKPTRGAMDAWGSRHVVIEVLEWGCFEESLRVMEPRTHSLHVRRMVDAIRDRKGAASSPEALAATDHAFVLSLQP